MTSATYRILEDGDLPGGALIEVVTGVVTEYGTRAGDGGLFVWPPDNTDYPTARRLGHAVRDGYRVVRRRVIVVEDWAEVDALLDADECRPGRLPNNPVLGDVRCRLNRLDSGKGGRAAVRLRVSASCTRDLASVCTRRRRSLDHACAQ